MSETATIDEQELPAVQEPQAEQSLTTRSPVTPPQMLQTAIERGADMEQIAKFMDLAERWEANQARKAFHAALAAFKADPPDLSKNRLVDFKSQRTGERTTYRHATLDHISATIGAALSRYGLSHSWKTEQADGNITVTCTLTHIDGHGESVSLAAGPDNSGTKNSIQAIGSTITYLERYTLLAITGLAAKDQDDDGAAASLEPISNEQLQELVELADNVGADKIKFCEFFGVGALAEIPAAKFESAKAALRKKGAAK